MGKFAVRVARQGITLPAKDAVRLGVQKNWTAKETAYETGWDLKVLQVYASRLNLSFAYGGKGSIPKYTNA